MKTMDTQTIAIEGVTNSAILSYFETLNSSNYEATSELFAIDGILQPPFEQPIVGRDAIAQYLNEEAKGITAHPKQGTVQTLDNGCTEFQIAGKVQTPLFSVNVSWQFVLSPNDELFLAKIKLIASPQELLGLRKDRSGANVEP